MPRMKKRIHHLPFQKELTGKQFKKLLSLCIEYGSGNQAHKRRIGNRIWKLTRHLVWVEPGDNFEPAKDIPIAQLLKEFDIDCDALQATRVDYFIIDKDGSERDFDFYDLDKEFADRDALYDWLNGSTETRDKLEQWMKKEAFAGDEWKFTRQGAGRKVQCRLTGR